MDKRLIKILIVIWSVIAIIAACFLVYGLSHNRNFEGIFSLMNRSGGADMVQKDENISVVNCNKINLDFSSTDILVQTTDESNLRVVQKASGKIGDEDKFKISKQGNSIIISEGSKNRMFNILHFDFGNFNERIELYIPKSYTADLNIHTASGNIAFNSDIKLNDIQCSQSSGDFQAKGDLAVNHISIKSSSGNINIENLDSKYYDVDATSGNICINSISGSGQAKAISGNVKIGYKGITEYSNVSSTSGNVNLVVPEKLSFQFTGDCTSGNINANFPLNYQNKRRSKATAKMGVEPYSKINASTISGNIDISK